MSGAERAEKLGVKTLNLGCGRDVHLGFVNMDILPGPGVDVVHDMETVPWPFKDSEFFVVIAERSLEHVIHLDRVVFEVARILESGGHFRVRVPYGLRSLYDPFHHRAFNKSSFRRFTTEDSDLHSAPLFTVKRIAYDHAYPLKWHLATHLGIKNLPIGPRAHILFDLVRTAWRSETWHKP